MRELYAHRPVPSPQYSIKIATTTPVKIIAQFCFLKVGKNKKNGKIISVIIIASQKDALKILDYAINFVDRLHEVILSTEKDKPGLGF